MKNKLNNKTGLIIFFIAAVSVVARLIINYSTELMPGAVGAFYLVQVRSVIETGSLIYNEFPLIFFVEAAFAKAIIFLCGMNEVGAIDNAVRIFDAVIPAVSIVPAFLLVNKLIGASKNKSFVIVCAAFSILYFSFFSLVSDYQKNSLAIVWLFFMLLALYNYLKVGGPKYLFVTILFYIIVGITHFGSFAIANLFLLLTAWIKYLQGADIKKVLLLTAELVVLAGAGTGLIYYFSPDRLELLLNSHKEIFYEPILFLIFNGSVSVSPIDIINIIFVNAIGLIAAVLLISKKNEIERHKKIFLAAAVLMDLTLAFPLLGVEWGQRLYLMAYVFALPLLAFIYESARSKKYKTVFVSLLVIIYSASISLAVITKQYSNIERDGYSEIESMKYIFDKEGSHLIVARLGLNYWLDWILRKGVTQEKDVKAHWWKSFDNIYYLKQIKGTVTFGTAGLYGKQFSDPAVPGGAELIFKGNFYNLYLAHNPPEYLIKK